MAKKKYAPRHDTGELFAKDDLQRINGIGPAVEKRLNGVGIFTFAQLAALSPADIAAAIADLSGLSAERIIKQDWIGQTRILAAESVASEAQQDVKAPLEEQDLALIHRVGLQQVDQPASGSLSSKAQQNTEVLEVTEQFHVHSEEPPFLDTEEPDQVLAVIAEYKSPAPQAAKPRVTGILQVHDVEMIGDESTSSGRILIHDEPFDVRLTLDLTELHMPSNTPLDYKASIYGKGKGRTGVVVGKAQGTILQTDKITITVGGNTLPEGIYRLAATVIVGPLPMKLTAKPRTLAIIDGGLVHVY